MDGDEAGTGSTSETTMADDESSNLGSQYAEFVSRAGSDYTFEGAELRRAHAEAARDEDDNHFRVALFWVVMALMVLTEVAMVLLFFMYMAKGAHWNPPSSTLNLWIGATTAQVFSVVLVVTRHLFPLSRSPRRSVKAAPWRA